MNDVETTDVEVQDLTEAVAQTEETVAQTDETADTPLDHATLEAATDAEITDAEATDLPEATEASDEDRHRADDLGRRSEVGG